MNTQTLEHINTKKLHELLVLKSRYVTQKWVNSILGVKYIAKLNVLFYALKLFSIGSLISKKDNKYILFVILYFG